MEEEKIFNLQLLVQKQEEELVLYRNGVNVAELLDLIKEKDTELEAANHLIKSKEETLRKLAKSSSEVLAKCDAALEEKEAALRETCILQDSLAQSKSELETQKEKCSQQQERQGELERLLSEQTHMIDTMNSALSVQEEDIDAAKAAAADLASTLAEKENVVEQLHKRCADLVAAKNDKVRELDQEREEMVVQVQQFRESVSVGVAKRDEALAKRNSKLTTANERIAELKHELQAREKEWLEERERAEQREEERAAEREQRWQEERMQLSLTHAEMDGQLEKMRKENEALTAKIVGLDVKLHQQQEKDKRRVLRERVTNIPSSDPNSSSSPTSAVMGGPKKPFPLEQSNRMHVPSL